MLSCAKNSVILNDQPNHDQLVQTIQQLQARNEQLVVENALLRQKIHALSGRRYGRGSETMSDAQLELFMSQEPEGVAGVLPEPEPPANSERGRPGRKVPSRGRTRWPGNLPVVEEVIEPEEVQAAPEQWRRIGQEVTELLDYEPGRFQRLRQIRPKYVLRHDPLAAPVVAPLPEVLRERGMAAPGLLAQVLVAKYCDHLPLYRQEQIYLRRHGVSLSRQNLSQWVGLGADWLRPLYEEIRAGVTAEGYVQVDETPIRYLAPGSGKAPQGYLWTVCRPGKEIFYHWETSRGAKCLENIIPVYFKGKMQCDGYNAYASFAARRRDIELVSCLAHIRRKFYEAREQDPVRAGFLLRQIKNLYRIEARLRRQRAGPALRQAVRESESRSIMKRIRKVLVLLKGSGRYLPASGLGKAIDYALNQWDQLGHCLEDGRLELDNNLVENAIRPTALGKKNWLFFGAPDAGRRGAIIYTIIESCRRHGIDPYTYLRDVFTRLPTMTTGQVASITPEAWAKARRLESQARAA